MVTFLHTVLLSENLKFRTALVVCPLNTILNWVSEFKKWQDDMGQDTVKVRKAIPVLNTTFCAPDALCLTLSLSSPYVVVFQTHNVCYRLQNWLQ